jgi:hypothetical protein
MNEYSKKQSIEWERRSYLGLVLPGILLGADEDELAVLAGLLLLGSCLLLLLGQPLLLALPLLEQRLRHRHLRRLGRHLHGQKTD